MLLQHVKKKIEFILARERPTTVKFGRSDAFARRTSLRCLISRRKNAAELATFGQGESTVCPQVTCRLHPCDCGHTDSFHNS